MRDPEEYYFMQGYDEAAVSVMSENPYNEGFAQHNWWNEGFEAYLTELMNDQ